MRNTGTNWSAIAMKLGLPDYNVDLDGNIRGADGSWDRGAYEYAPTNVPAAKSSMEVPAAKDSFKEVPAAKDSFKEVPAAKSFVDVPAAKQPLVYFDFEDDFILTNRILDKSLSNRDAWRYGKAANPTNYPTREYASSVPGRGNVSGYAAKFDWWNDRWGDYGKSGQYAAITNTSALANMPEATIMVWGKYNAVRSDQGTSHAADNNAAMVSAGYGSKGAWQLGRYGDPYTIFQVTTNASGPQRDLRVRFPDAVWTSKGNTTNWHHYCVSFDHGDVKGYFDGRLFTNVQMQVTELTIGKNNNVPRPWIALGCWTHDGTPQQDDAEGKHMYPNNGWFNGYLDNVRIYNTVLAPEEIGEIFVEEGGRTQTAPKPPKAPATSSQKSRSKKPQ
jgi:hypothetical protein